VLDFPAISLDIRCERKTGEYLMNSQDNKTNPDAAAAADAAADIAAEAAAEYAAQNAAHYADEAAEQDTAEPGADAPAAETPEEIIVRLEAEKAELTQRFVQIAADMENLRKRTARETADARKFAVSKFAEDILGVSDNLQRAREAATQGEDALMAIVEGIDVTARELARILEKHGVSKIPAEGHKFDPHLHQAMFEVPDESVPARTVVQLVQDGYMIGDRILRAALVGVSKGGPKGEAAPESAQTPAGDASEGADGGQPDHDGEPPRAA
jgi:molecular chaperone GrpE